jgi:succinylglutamic semialdehyde dehydrogenase
MSNYIKSFNPSDSSLISCHKITSKDAINTYINNSLITGRIWSSYSFSKRKNALMSFQRILIKNQSDLAAMIALETGKSKVESAQEVVGAINKIDLTIQAYQDRVLSFNKKFSSTILQLSNKPLGTILVLGPFNFPVHLPLGHIFPAILSGNCILYKPSEHVFGVTKLLMNYFDQSSILDNVVQFVYGGSQEAEYLISKSNINGIFFTGSYNTACLISRQISDRPEILFAMECGGNNPLVISSYKNQKVVLDSIIKSAYLTSGQRCTCARRLIVVDNVKNRALIKQLVKKVNLLKIGLVGDEKDFILGPLISEQACDNVIKFSNKLIKIGGKVLVKCKRLDRLGFYVSPGLIDMSGCVTSLPDEECFGPLLQLIFVQNFFEACELANNTSYGLSASLFSVSKNEFNQFFNIVNAGIVNWNQPTNGASSQLPFGGVGKSGNFRPAGFAAIDSCVYPVSSILNV